MLSLINLIISLFKIVLLVKIGIRLGYLLRSNKILSPLKFVSSQSLRALRSRSNEHRKGLPLDSTRCVRLYMRLPWHRMLAAVKVCVERALLEQLPGEICVPGTESHWE